MIELDKIYNEDCLEGMKRIPDGMVDAIITDLPYGVLNEQSEGGSWDSIIPLEPMWEQFKRVTKPNAAIVLFCQGMFTAKLMMSQPKLWRYNLIWDKVRTTGFLNCKRMPMRQHEDICVFYQQLPTYNPQMEACLPHQRNHSRGPRKDDNTNRCYGKFKDAEPFISDEKYPKSIVCYPNVVQQNDHPTQKPVDLIRYLVLTYSNEGGGDSRRYNGQWHDRHRLHQGASALHRLRDEQGVFRQGREAHQAGTGATDVILIFYDNGLN